MAEHVVVRHRNHHKRFFGWLLLYIAIILLFLAYVYRQGSKINTLQLPSGEIQLTTSKSKYTVGDTVSFTIKNTFSSPVYMVDKCPQELLHVYQFKNSAWVRLHDNAKSSTCPVDKKAVAIDAGKSITENYANWPQLFNSPGIYRIAAFADNYPTIAYADFLVVAKPLKPLPAPAPLVIYKPVYTPVYTPIYIPAPNRDGGGD